MGQDQRWTPAQRRGDVRALGVASLVLALAACIPQAERPYSPPPPPPPPEARPSDPAPQDIPGRDTEVRQLPAPRPAWESRPVTPDAVEVPDGSYVVRPGDNLRRVGNATGVGSEALARANALEAPFVIRPGQRLAVPGGRYHLVQPGQTGIAIARAYGVEWSRIVTANALEEPYILRVGQRVLIPGTQRTASGEERGPSAAERAAAFTLDIDDILTGGEPAIAANQAPARPVTSSRRVLPATAAITTPLAAPGQFAWPLDGEVVKRFGRGGTGERNDGIEIAAPVDTPVRAAADGTVAYVGDGIAALGGLVIVKHGGGWTSIYGHASSLKVQRGQAVKRGQVLALSGDTGFADRPELHFELRRGRTPVDPLGQLPRR